MKFDHYEYTIADHWASAIINADYMGLDDEEEAQLTQWMNDNEQRGSHWDIEDYDGGFARDEISGLYANCVKAIQYFPMRG
jgi:hypothetical protein